MTGWRDTDGKRVDASDYVHELASGRWLVACWSERASQYHAPMTPEGRRITGAHTVCSRSLTGLNLATTCHYARRADAVRRAADIHGWERA